MKRGDREEVDDFWVVTHTGGAPADLMHDEGFVRVCMLRIEAFSSLGDGTNTDVTYALDQDDASKLIAGLIQMAGLAWGQQAFQHGVARALGISPELREASIRLVNAALGKMGDSNAAPE